MHPSRWVYACLALFSSTAWAVGEGPGGFPNWSERVIHEWINRARAEPQAELSRCGAACGEAACYAPVAPLAYDLRLNRAARFHSDEMARQGYFDHDSHCTVVQSIDRSYPASCDGSAGCACTGGVAACNPTCTTFAERVALFGASPGAEIIAGATDPNDAFYSWLFEANAGGQCGYSPTNGHRYSILTSTAGVGLGVNGPPTGDFSLGGGAAPARIPSAAHYPRSGASVEIWASWYDVVGPTSARVDVDGACTAMTRQRGTESNGAWSATVSGLQSGCHRYYVVFQDGTGAEVTWPTTGSLGIGDASCADWDPSRPASCAGDASDGGMVGPGGGAQGAAKGNGGCSMSRSPASTSTFAFAFALTFTWSFAVARRRLTSRRVKGGVAPNPTREHSRAHEGKEDRVGDRARVARSGVR